MSKPLRQMASARSHTASSPRSQRRPAAGRPAQSFRPRRVRSRAPLVRIRWDRAARAGLLAVLALIAYLWISGLMSLWNTHAQAAAGLAQVHRLAAENRRLIDEETALHQRGTILARARDLGMVRQGEQSFILTH